ncbi:hypothetical protein PILCRDRAFT_4965 [Piloderma croceum F 1598]|uniref:Uncharacterized protein n=1 Tax=Piloderma croceum (strain F 1598) TaxID=765440 RepID=A0A0C3C9U6_PILCF|nr:hypothetical protein PILCRDRAFT_4965 [Piloderma croceum F 1598]
MHSPRRTRSMNATQHPGLVVKPAKRRTPAEVKAATDAKEVAKEAKKQAKEASINRAAEFENNAMANEDIMDATPRPNFDPRPSTPTETASETETIDIEMSDRPNFDNHTYVPPEDPTEDDTMGSEDFADKTPIPLSKKRRGATTEATKATKWVALTRLFAIADLAAEAPLKRGQPKSHDDQQRQPKSKAADDDTSPANIMDDSATESDDQPPPTKKARAKKTAEQSVEIIDRSAAKSNGAPSSKVKFVEDLEDKKMKKKKESIHDAIEAVQVKTMEDLDSDSRNRPSVDIASRLKSDAKGKLAVKAERSEPMRFGNGPQWVPKLKGSDGSKGKQQGLGGCVIDIESSDDEKVPAKATSDPPTKKFKYSVESWARSVPVNAKPPSRAPSHTNTATSTSRTLPSLTNASSRSTGHSVLTDAITITSTVAPRVQIKPDPNFIDIHDGGLSDHDEIRGRERDAAVFSPPKGKTRLNSEALVVETKPKISKNTGESSKRAKNSDLPSEIDFKIWRRVFVPMFMRWVSQQDNPFEHNTKLGCEVMQQIWDAIFPDVPYTIIPSGPVHALTAQCTSDSWRNTVGSTGIAVPLAYCNSHPDLKDSDDNRQEFAAHYLKHLCFLYKRSDGNDPKKYKGAFCGPFVLQTFAASLTALQGARKIDGLDDPDESVARSYGGLALAAAAVKRGLKFIASGIITIEMVQDAKGKVPTLPKQINQSTGRVSHQLTGFNEVTWGMRCKSYVKSAKGLSATRFDEVVRLATEFTKINHGLIDEDDDIIEIEEEEDIRANIIDISSGSEDEAESSKLPVPTVL